MLSLSYGLVTVFYLAFRSFQSDEKKSRLKKGSLWADLHEKDLNPLYGKRWCLYILPQYLANLTEPLANIKSHILAKFITVRTKLCI